MLASKLWAVEVFSTLEHAQDQFIVNRPVKSGSFTYCYACQVEPSNDLAHWKGHSVEDEKWQASSFPSIANLICAVFTRANKNRRRRY